MRKDGSNELWVKTSGACDLGQYFTRKALYIGFDFSDLKSRYGLAIGAVVVLVLILIAVGGVVGLYIYK